MGGVNIVAAVLEEPGTPVDQGNNILCVRHGFFLLGNHPVQVAEKVTVQTAQQQANAILPAISSRILKDAGYGSAYSIVLQDQFKSFLRMNLLLISNLNDRRHVFVFIGTLDGGDHGRRISDSPKVRPCPRNVVFSQEQFAGFACSVNERLFIASTLVRRYFFAGATLNQWQSKLKPLPQNT